MKPSHETNPPLVRVQTTEKTVKERSWTLDTVQNSKEKRSRNKPVKCPQKHLENPLTIPKSAKRPFKNPPALTKFEKKKVENNGKLYIPKFNKNKQK